MGHLARIGDRRSAYAVLVGRPDGKRPLGRFMRRSENNVKWIFKKCDEEAWTGLSWLSIGKAGWRL
jgi:hypothetical protein